MTGRFKQALLEMKKSKKGRKGKMPKNFSVSSGDKSKAGGLTKKGVKRYRAANPGSELKTAVTTKPSKLKKGSKAANRRKSFCARMGGMKKKLTSKKTAGDSNSRINKALRKWNCSTDVNPNALQQMAEMILSEISVGRLKDYRNAALEREKRDGDVSARRSNFIGRAEDRIRKASEKNSDQQKKAGGEHGNTGSSRNVAAAGGGENFQQGTKTAPQKAPQGRITPDREKALGDAANRVLGKNTRSDPMQRTGATASLDTQDAGRGRTRNLPGDRRKRAEINNAALKRLRQGRSVGRRITP